MDLTSNQTSESEDLIRLDIDIIEDELTKLGTLTDNRFGQLSDYNDNVLLDIEITPNNRQSNSTVLISNDGELDLLSGKSKRDELTGFLKGEIPLGLPGDSLINSTSLFPSFLEYFTSMSNSDFTKDMSEDIFASIEIFYLDSNLPSIGNMPLLDNFPTEDNLYFGSLSSLGNTDNLFFE